MSRHPVFCLHGRLEAACPTCSPAPARDGAGTTTDPLDWSQFPGGEVEIVTASTRDRTRPWIEITMATLERVLGVRNGDLISCGPALDGTLRIAVNGVDRSAEYHRGLEAGLPDGERTAPHEEIASLNSWEPGGFREGASSLANRVEEWAARVATPDQYVLTRAFWAEVVAALRAQPAERTAPETIHPDDLCEPMSYAEAVRKGRAMEAIMNSRAPEEAAVPTTAPIVFRNLSVAEMIAEMESNAPALKAALVALEEAKRVHPELWDQIVRAANRADYNAANALDVAELDARWTEALHENARLSARLAAPTPTGDAPATRTDVPCDNCGRVGQPVVGTKGDGWWLWRCRDKYCAPAHLTALSDELQAYKRRAELAEYALSICGPALSAITEGVPAPAVAVPRDNLSFDSLAQWSQRQHEQLHQEKTEKSGLRPLSTASTDDARDATVCATTAFVQSTPIPDADAARLLREDPSRQTTGWEAMLVRHVEWLESQLHTATTTIPEGDDPSDWVCDREEATRRAIRRYPSAHDGSRCTPVQVRGERRCACEFSP